MTRGRGPWTVLAVLLVGTIVVSAAPVATADASLDDETGAISGDVTSTGGDSLAGASVSIYEADDDDSPVATATTDEDGVYEVEGLAVGEYDVEAEHEGDVAVIDVHIPEPGMIVDGDAVIQKDDDADEEWWAPYTNDEGVVTDAADVVDAIESFENGEELSAADVLALIESFETDESVPALDE